MQRVTEKQLNQMTDIINAQLGVTASEAWTLQDDGTFKANIGYHHILASGYGYSMVRICTDGGGVTDIFRANTKRELMQQMRAFSVGLATKNEG